MNRAGAAILDIGSHLHRPRIFRALGGTLFVLTCAVFAWGLLASSPALSQSVLPFPDPPSDSVAKRTLQESEYRPNPPVSRLPENAPNILIVLMDDVGPAQSRTFGGDIATPTMDQIVAQGIAYNRFHTTAMCSPTRASLLTGRNHHWVGNGQIAELANDWDGYSGVIPKTSATLAEVLKNYGYSTGAWGKWHNTSAIETTTSGPFDNWPTGYGFEYFYGFLAGEASQWEPNLVRNTTYVDRPETSGGNAHYHLSEDLADDAITWLREHKAFAPDKPFFMYWAPGASHGPHHVPREWADKYSGVFDDGWDAARERYIAAAKAKGWIPPEAQLTARAPTMAGWQDIPEHQRDFQRRLMEVYAGFTEHADVQAGRVIAELDRLGYRDNTIVIYIWGDNGASAEGQSGTISELLAQNSIPTTTDQHIAAVEALGGLGVLGSDKTDNMYHAGWAWAGATPYRSTKLVAAHFGGTRNPMAIRWPERIAPDATPRSQFHHVNDIVPTIYELLAITPPDEVNGYAQDPIHGVSMAYTFDAPEAPGQLKTQYFEILGSRGIYHDGWFASAFGPRAPWMPGVPPGFFDANGQLAWTPDDDVWELYNLEEDWSQANDLSAQMPGKLAEMQALFEQELVRNKGYPIGGGLFVPIMRPDLKPSTPYSEWHFSGDMRRMPTFVSPRIQAQANTVAIDLTVPDNPEGVLYAKGGFAGGVALYIHDGRLSYEYNLFEIQRTQIKAQTPLAPGPRRIEVITEMAEAARSMPIKVTLLVDGEEVASGVVPVTAQLGFAPNETFDVGIDLQSPVSPDYHEAAPFEFNGEIDRLEVKYTP